MCSDLLNKIQTKPVLIHNTLAKNFNWLKLSIKFQLVGDSYYWTHLGLKPSQTTIYNPILKPACGSRNDNGFHVTCRQVSCGKSAYIISSLTLMFPLNTSVTFRVYEQKNLLRIEKASVDVQVKGKSTCFVDNRSGYIRYHLCTNF